MRTPIYDMEAQRHASFSFTLGTKGLIPASWPTLSVQIRRNAEAPGDPLATPTIAWSGTDLVISLTLAQINALPVSPNPSDSAVFYYDIRIANSTKTVRILEGRFVVHPGVTRNA